MLLSLAAADRRTLWRGLTVLAVIVFVGVAVVETQLNRLTQRQEFAQALNLRRETDGYWRAYALGASTGVRTVYRVGSIASTDRSFTVSLADRAVTVPTVLYMNIDRPLYWLEIWRRQFIAEAFKTKDDLVAILEQLRPLIRKLAAEVRR